MIQFCKYCKKQLRRTNGKNCHVHCGRKAKQRKKGKCALWDIQQPRTDKQEARYNALIAKRAAAVRGQSFIHSRTPVDDSPAAELALRPDGVETDDYLESLTWRGARRA